METLTVNFNGATRTEKLNGKDYIVAPMTMIVPGVLNGSKGPMFYPGEELAKNAEAWNGMPIVINHPDEAVSARTPAILNKSGVGLVFNSRFENDKLQAEAWFDTEQVKNKAIDVYGNLTTGKKQELSTGLFVGGLEPATQNAEYNGVRYTHIARNYKPDHLAILPEQAGACSISDGCGVNNKETEESLSANSGIDKILDLLTNLTEKGNTIMDRDKVIAGLIANCECWSEDDKEVLNAMTDEQLLKHEKTVNEFVANAAKTKELTEQVETLTANAEKKPEEKPTETVENKEVKPMTDQEWLAQAPPGVQSVVKNSMDWEAGQKQLLINSMVKDQAEPNKAALIENLSSKSLEELRTLSLLTPVVEEVATPVANYIGSAVPAASQVTNEYDYSQDNWTDEDIDWSAN